MARPRNHTNADLPRYLHRKFGAIYYVRDGKWTRLADNVPDAIGELAKMMGSKVGAAVTAAVNGKATMTMGDLLTRALPIICQNIEPASAKGYYTRANQLRAGIGEVLVSEFKAKNLHAMRRKLGKAPGRFNAQLSVLNLAMDWAVEDEIIETNPCHTIKRLKSDQRTRYLTDAEFAAIYAKGNERLQVIMDILYETGQRVNDVLHIEWDHIVDADINFVQRKTDKKLTVGDSPALRRHLARAKALSKGTVVRLDRPRYLFTGRGGCALPYGTMQSAWMKACDDAGVKDAWIHDIRAKAATDTYLAHGGGDAGFTKAQALMGHATRKMTERYIRQLLPNVVQGPSAARTLAAVK